MSYFFFEEAEKHYINKKEVLDFFEKLGVGLKKLNMLLKMTGKRRLLKEDIKYMQLMPTCCNCL